MTPDTPARSAPVSYFTHASIAVWHRGLLIMSGVPAGIELRYHRDDPFAVTLLIDFEHPHPAWRQFEWRFARRMLADARTGVAGDPHGDIALRRCTFAQPHLIVVAADRAARHRYQFPLDLVDVNAALLVFDQIVALEAEPHIAPSLDAIGDELRAMLAAETGRDGDR